MVARIKITDYIKGRFNEAKLNKLESELEKLCKNFKTRQGQEYPENGILITVSMSAKYQTAFVRCEEWVEYQSVGEFEDLIKQALENRGFEFCEPEGEDDYFKITKFYPRKPICFSFMMNWVKIYMKFL